MSKELTPLEALKNIEKEVEDFEGFDENTCHQMDRTRFQIIETALKEKENQDILIKVIKEVFEFGIANNRIEEKDDGTVRVIGEIGFCLRRELENKEKELYRDFILRECFPKELKALEIIKEIVEKDEETDFMSLFGNSMVNIGSEEIENKYALLKEVLL